MNLQCLHPCNDIFSFPNTPLFFQTKMKQLNVLLKLSGRSSIREVEKPEFVGVLGS